jgi:hypothetical protein
MEDKMNYGGSAAPVNPSVKQAGAVQGQVPDGSFKAAGANVTEGRARTFSARMGGRKKSGGGKKSGSHNSMGKDY